VPALLATAIEQHLNVKYKQEFWEVVLLVASATEMAAALYRGDEQVPENFRLESLGINQTMQEKTYQQLGKKYQGCQEMARALFL
jgi:hypothetical protein